MGRSIIFLDFGGVLDSVAALSDPKRVVSKSGFPFDRKCVGVLNEILAKSPETQVVICSAARFSSTLDQMKRWLTAAGFMFNDRVIGALDPAETRNQLAIELWLAANPDVTAYAVLDDFTPAYVGAILERIPKTLTSSVGLSGVLPSAVLRILGVAS